MTRRDTRASTLVCALLCVVGCAQGSASEDRSARPLEVGDERKVELSYLRFDVTNFEKRLDQDDLLRLPRDVRERLWLLDLDLSSGPNSPQLVDQALSAIRELDPNMLPQAERNMQALLRMTPDTANLEGTSLASLIDLAPLLGVASQQVLADLFKMNVEDTFLSDAAIAATILKQVIATHPNAQTRLGPKTEQNPTGVYPVSPGTLPVTLTDLATNFETFGKRFGPYDGVGVSHPGFVGSTTAQVLTDQFAITVRANANALPYKGVDLTTTEVASVSSIRSQIEGLFDFADPNWMRVEGLVAGEPKIDSLTFRIVESSDFVKGGLSPTPAGVGDSLGWQLPPWTLERVVLGAAQSSYGKLNSQVAYAAAGKTDPLFSAKVIDGFQEIGVQGGIGSPPLPSYVWDLLLETAQVRLHDGGLREGEGNVAFTLRNVSLGTTTEEIQATVKANLRASPSSLLELTETVLASTQGAADFYYYRANDTNAPAQQGDWLYFVIPDDIENGSDGVPVRPYSYAHPGFYRDLALTQKVSTTAAVDGDTEHEKVRLEDNPELYVEDETGALYRLFHTGKSSTNRISLLVNRVR